MSIIQEGAWALYEYTGSGSGTAYFDIQITRYIDDVTGEPTQPDDITGNFRIEGHKTSHTAILKEYDGDTHALEYLTLSYLDALTIDKYARGEIRVDILDELTSITMHVTSLTITADTIGYMAFTGHDINTMSITAGKISDSAFIGSTANIDVSVRREVGFGAFSGCEHMNDVQIADGCIVKPNAFANCYTAQFNYDPQQGSMLKFGNNHILLDQSGGSHFANCSRVTRISFDDDFIITNINNLQSAFYCDNNHTSGLSIRSGLREIIKADWSRNTGRSVIVLSSAIHTLLAVAHNNSWLTYPGYTGTGQDPDGTNIDYLPLCHDPNDSKKWYYLALDTEATYPSEAARNEVYICKPHRAGTGTLAWYKLLDKEVQ